MHVASRPWSGWIRPQLAQATWTLGSAGGSAAGRRRLCLAQTVVLSDRLTCFGISSLSFQVSTPLSAALWALPAVKARITIAVGFIQ